MTDSKSPKDYHRTHAIINIAILILTVVSPLFLLSPHFIKIGFIGCLVGAFIGITNHKPEWLINSSLALSCFANILLVVAFCPSPAIVILAEASVLLGSLKNKDIYHDLLNLSNSLINLVTLAVRPELGILIITALPYYIAVAYCSLGDIVTAKSNTSLRTTIYPSYQHWGYQKRTPSFSDTRSFITYNPSNGYNQASSSQTDKDWGYQKRTPSSSDTRRSSSVLRKASSSGFFSGSGWDSSSSRTNSGGLFGGSSSSTIDIIGGIFSGGSLGNWSRYQC